ncbi:histidine kinase [Paenibacillus sp. J31TS4]|uniref:cache domain-containing sensor histidine kinase n=1 Tax=Paenibacillus sp. J31TS4 TaxID=2807195 RepID=UPI001B20E022|nr:sensor histidine kinase [Paenibacillus sp. J31TS4]GIP37238.1 histidine kinase [Paenibacillus sp. J31TS4]
MKKSLARQLFVYFLIVIVLSLSSVGAVSYIQSSFSIERLIGDSISQTVANASTQTDFYLKPYEDVSASILSSSDVKHFLDMDPADSYDYFYYSDQIKKTLFRPLSIQYPQLNTIYVLAKHGRAVADQDIELEGRLEQLWGRTPENGGVVFLNTAVRKEQKNVITVARRIRGFSSYEPNGLLAIELKLSELAKLWQHVDLGERSAFFILDPDGRYVYRPENRASALPPSVAERLLTASSVQFNSTEEKERRMYVGSTSSLSGWTVAASLPTDRIRSPIRSIGWTTLLVGLLTLAASSWLALRFGRSIVRPIRQLMEGMRETEKGNWTYLPPVKREDELGGLMHSYNLMVSRLSGMIERVYEAELASQKAALDLKNTQLERQRAEFQALQLQINPHFLYNTLETINCYAIVKDSEEITAMVEALAFMLRYSLQTNLEEITVANELNHVRNYLLVLEHRIQRGFELEVAVPPELLLEKMVRLTLQPLVENVFQHAFPDGLEEGHRIRIDARKERGLLLLLVEDNGIGISPDRLAELRERLGRNRLAKTPADTGRERGGIGLLNVHRRIQMVFGEDYGLSIDSTPGKGTTICMIMPAEPADPKKED